MLRVRYPMSGRLTSHGIALVSGEADLHHAENTSVWAWDGSTWLHVHDDYRSWEVRGARADRDRSSGLRADAASICLDPSAAVATFDIDSDGRRDSVYRVPCRDHEDGHGCGNWVTATRGACRIPLGVLADGVVVLAQPARADQPAIVRSPRLGRAGLASSTASIQLPGLRAWSSRRRARATGPAAIRHGHPRSAWSPSARSLARPAVATTGNGLARWRAGAVAVRAAPSCALDAVAVPELADRAPAATGGMTAAAMARYRIVPTSRFDRGCRRFTVGGR